MSVRRRCDPETIFELADGALGAERAREARLHLDECPECHEIYEKELEINALLRSTDLANPRSRSVCPMVAMALPTRPLKARLLWASTALILLLAASLALSLDGANPLVFVVNTLGVFWGVVSGFADLARTTVEAAGPILLAALVVGALLDLCLAAALLWMTRRRSREA
ncbi:MAG TPA: zf-HC2 domain-containing protein [Rubrobacteraceae bacterium]|nr:zf-HC2 domain-containing protein [Rubrobacteraceae bacterium]